MAGFFLGGDIGGTASRFAVADGTGAIVERGVAPGATGHTFNATARAELVRSIEQIAASLTRPVDAAVLGLTGYGPRARSDIEAIIGHHLGVVPERIFVSDDIELAFRALFQPGKGHLVSAGTGSIAVHLREDGSIFRIGGRGILIDDAGAGAWIALAAVRALYRRIDETGSPGDMQTLANALYAAIGADDWSDMRSFIYGGDRGRIGALARPVAEAARAGDIFAQNLLVEAGHALARLGNILIQRAGPHPVAFIGGVLKLDPVIADTIRRELAGEALFPVLDQAEGAARLALSLFSDNPAKSGSNP
ncbi:N-acetylglucosamine kinase [Martelella endophytica]|uniref:N-acetylglucosamine kinase n=1 Tax=Martelella endophytica TaxID=1486262 RepID=UPI0005F196BE|nr:BadF/BadG/BcrA/BcrD ATPase family protein [Martelella endophytica]